MIEGRREGRREEARLHGDDGFRDGLEGRNPELHSLHQSQPLVIFDVSRRSDDGMTKNETTAKCICKPGDLLKTDIPIQLSLIHSKGRQ
jgi:hypothetical protein